MTLTFAEKTEDMCENSLCLMSLMSDDILKELTVTQETLIFPVQGPTNITFLPQTSIGIHNGVAIRFPHVLISCDPPDRKLLRGYGSGSGTLATTQNAP